MGEQHVERVVPRMCAARNQRNIRTMKSFEGHASRTVDAPPDAVFALVTNIERLAEWNAAIEEVIDRPTDLRPGAEWTVRMHPPRLPAWGSISKVEEHDPATRRFTYGTRNADGNPSSVSWAWSVEPSDDGTARVTVSWECVLRTFDRRFFAGPIRKRGLAREVPRSLDALAAVVDGTAVA